MHSLLEVLRHRPKILQNPPRKHNLFRHYFLQLLKLPLKGRRLSRHHLHKLEQAHRQLHHKPFVGIVVEFEFDGDGRQFELETIGGLVYGEVDGLFLLFGG
jgi:hypothetical protein